jgi:hypothetical protein
MTDPTGMLETVDGFSYFMVKTPSGLRNIRPHMQWHEPAMVVTRFAAKFGF